MTVQQKNIILSCARGWWQRSIAHDLASGEVVSSPVRTLRGRASAYTGRYVESFRNLLSRIENAGFRVQRTPGIRGGEWGATYRIRQG